MPQRPTIEPTERSMPPVMMTKVMPIARKALSATCFDIRIMFAVDRKFGAKIEKKMMTAKSAMKVLSFISVRRMEPLRPLAAKAVEVAVVMTRVSLVCPCPLAEAATMASSVASFRSRIVDQLAVAHDGDAIGERHDLFEVGGRKQDGEAFAGKPAHGAEDIGLGADIDAAARLVHQKHLRIGHQRLADDDLLLIAAGHRGDVEIRVRRLDREVADRVSNGRSSRASPSM